MIIGKSVEYREFLQFLRKRKVEWVNQPLKDSPSSHLHEIASNGFLQVSERKISEDEYKYILSERVGVLDSIFLEEGTNGGHALEFRFRSGNYIRVRFTGEDGVYQNTMTYLRTLH